MPPPVKVHVPPDVEVPQGEVGLGEGAPLAGCKAIPLLLVQRNIDGTEGDAVAADDRA